MMLDPIDLAFFRELAEVCVEHLGAEDPCTKAANRAVATGHPDDLRAARLCVDALDDAVREKVQRQTHHRLAGNLSLIWDQLSGASGDGPVN